jgi:integrase
MAKHCDFEEPGHDRHTVSRFAVLFALLAGSGLRAGEALALKPTDFSPGSCARGPHLAVARSRATFGH